MNNRCEIIIKMLKEAKGPLSASKLADSLGVSRQIIVGDVALIRASGHNVVATSRGYVFNSQEGEAAFPYTGILACRHTDNETMREELYTIVDFGGTVIDVKVEHAIYGELSGKLDITSRFDVDQFMKKVEEDNSPPISRLTGGIHLHTIGCGSRELFEIIRENLLMKGIAFEEN